MEVPAAPAAPRGGRGGGGGFGGGGGGFGGGAAPAAGAAAPGGAGGAVAGGGRGGRGGGRGGAGGGAARGRGATTGVEDYTPDNAARRARELASAGIDEPLVITLEARDDEAFKKLAEDLTTYAVTNTDAPAFGGAGNFVQQGQVSNGIMLNNQGVLVLDNNATEINNYGNLARQQRGTPPPRAYNEQAQQALNGAARPIQDAITNGGVYLVPLRPEQIEDLSKNYRVTAVSRGDNLYLFRAQPDEQPPPATEVRARNNDLVNRAGVQQRPVTNVQTNIAPRAPGSLVDVIVQMEKPGAQLGQNEQAPAMQGGGRGGGAGGRGGAAPAGPRGQ
jgi:hypothetical protein